ncbi:MarR family winged helix-turn-helix transcriptional regulator [Comamonadaceae bacterium G21597-S1]|nr:MarR family winged helix-turn-helix transcriptional regulator [Comamonadaceae bacterium G21597-S1]
MNASRPPATPASVTVKPRGCTNLLLHQLVRQLDQLYDAELGKSGLKTTQYSLLSHVVRLGPIRPGALARAMKMQPSTLTRNLQLLQAAGWVAVGAGDDARSRSVSATDSGREKHQQAQRHWKAVQLELNRRLGESQVAALHLQLNQAMAGLAITAAAKDSDDN